jgi:DNA mismatch endonuclease (patch repair protein)
MKRVKLKDGSLEKLVQQELRTKGLRLRCHVRTLPGSPDIAFTKEKVAVFVDGDFWHGWRLPAWEHKLSKFWRDKLRTNRARDQRNFRRLRADGWKIIRIWQHELKRDGCENCVERILRALR